MIAPKHVGFIVDGNRRWAKAKGLLPWEGHRAGYARVKEVARWLFSRGTAFASFYLFSRENWKRSQDEVSFLMALLEEGLKNDTADYIRDSIRVRFAGSKENLSPIIQSLMQQVEADTASGEKGTVFACINYGGQQEIVEAVQRLAQNDEDLKKITIEKLKASLTTADLPPADLIIRTSGEQRLSNFLLWESAYAELYFTPRMFPDFDEAELDKALVWYADRQRRFGI